MSKALFFGAAAIGGMAFFTLVSRYSLCRCMTETGTAGGGGKRRRCPPRAERATKICAGPRRARSSKAKTN